MKKTLLTLATLSLAATSALGFSFFHTTQAKPQLKPAPITCNVFLKNTIVEDQLYEDFGEHAQLQVNYDKAENFCTLTIKTDDGKNYQFSSKSPDNFVYQNKNLALYLYENNHPQVRNTIEADYEFNQILDVATDFPAMS